MGFIYKYKYTITGIVAGGIAGYLYYHFIGCASGTCAITSNPLNSTLYGAVMGALLVNTFKKEEPINKFKKTGTMSKEQTIVDVRTPGEFMGGHVAGSINIPLQEIQERLEEVKALGQPIILCCASGNRSGQATSFLRSQGIECTNGGSWLDVNRNC